MTQTKKLIEAAVPMLTTIPDTALVAVFDPTSGAVSKTDFATLKQAVRDSIQIGGRNLIVGSKDFSGWSSKTGASISADKKGIFSVFQSSRDWSGAFKPFSFESGIVYTFSVYCNNLEQTSIYLKYVRDDAIGINQTASFEPIRTDFRCISKGFYQKSVTAKCIGSGVAALEFETTTAIQSPTIVQFYAPKLEIGNMATDWTPAPEDLNWGG